MKKNRALQLLPTILLLTLISSSLVGSTYARYVTDARAIASARYAHWGFTGESSIELDDLFSAAYQNVEAKEDVIAPGTQGAAAFGFAYRPVTVSGEKIEAPEVAYTFKVSTEGSRISPALEAHDGIRWRLDRGPWGTWQELLGAIEALAGSGRYEPHQLPAGFSGADSLHLVQWCWEFEAEDDPQTPQDERLLRDTADTLLGNTLMQESVVLQIQILAEQID